MENEEKRKNAKKNNKKTTRKTNYTISDLEKIKKNQEVIDMYVEDIDESLNMIGFSLNKIKSIIPRDEASSIVGDDGLVEEKYIVNKKGKILHVCIKDIIKNDDKIELILSKKALELKVRKWMYMYLKPGMKLKGTVVNAAEYACFVDVGGGVIGILKSKEITDNVLKTTADVFKIGQKIDVIVKKYDRDTGRIELSYKDILGSFEDNVKNLKEGDIVEGIIRNRIKTGIFVELKPNLVGMAEHVNGLEYGQKVLVSIKKISLEKKKIKLIIIG